jgi:predicted AAA+ superfamily ATPase
VNLAPEFVLAGPTPRLIDEWQIEPSIWNHVRRAVDDRKRPGQFILTGSAVPADDESRHAGAGRITRLRMRPMSLFETGHSTGATSLMRLLQGDPAATADPGLSIVDLIERVAVGGWPGREGFTVTRSLRANRDYLGEIARVDVARVAGPRRDPNRVSRLLRSLARNTATYASITTLAADTGDSASPLDRETVAEYLDALARLFIVEDQPPWAPALRSKSIMRGEGKRHLCDPSLAVAAMRATPDRLLRDLNLFGFLFESLVVRDLRVYAQASDAHVLQYRDNTGLEVDAIVEAADGRWAAFEVKLGPSQVDEAATTLLRFAERVDTTKVDAPVVLGVIVGFGYGFVRPDGVAVIPIGSLAP